MTTFAGIPERFAEYDTSKVVLIPVPYDGTSTWGKGADKGPTAFLDAACNMELYDIETNSEVYKKGITLGNPVVENSSAEAMCNEVELRVKHELNNNKFVTLFGGEHSISIGSIKAHVNKFNDVTVLQLDAHADLRPSYMGSEYNHACALHWASKNTNLIQVGIRSMDIYEREHMNFTNTFFAHDIFGTDNEWMDEVLQLCTSNVYITIDLDVFDPGIMPSTGTPEPGGMRWYQLLRLCKIIINRRNVVGFDIVELCPNSASKASDFLAAKLYYKLLSYKFC